MSQLDQSLLDFRTKMSARADRIKRGSHATEVTVSPLQNGQFTISVGWKNRDGTSGSHTESFSIGVFSRSGTTNWRLRQPPCRFADDIIRNVLTKRGVIR